MSRLSWLLSNSVKMAVPAGIYLAMNMLGFVSLHRIDAGTFAVVQQSKIFFTALFGRIFLGRVLSQPKFQAMRADASSASLKPPIPDERSRPRALPKRTSTTGA